ncbi:MAG: short-chain dehydrogenase/reductase [Puniceicoccaceae bacterium 5H]|nr:MAG: short-chain dehydrogenase/reductase [Puniceicoccaceae bacterium 5H]
MSTSSTPTRVAIVTGSSRGIGAETALRLAQDGFALVINYAHSASAAEQVVRQIQDAGGQAVAVQADVAKTEDAAKLFDTAEQHFGGADVLVNSAGVMQPGMVDLKDTDDALYHRIVSTNLNGTFNTLRLAATRLRNGGRIVTFSTSVVGMALPGYSVYAATKAAVEMLTRILAKELRGRQITVNTVAPGPTATSMFLDHKTEEQIDRMAKAAPLERLGKAEDIANLIAFLVGPEGGWVNGQTVRANGGLV